MVKGETLCSTLGGGCDLHFEAKLKFLNTSKTSFLALWWIFLRQFVPSLYQVMVKMSVYVKEIIIGWGGVAVASFDY